MRRGPIGLAVATGRERLAAAGCDTPLLDSELLLGSVLGVGRAQLVIDRLKALPEAVWARFEALVARRAAHEPIAYILGRREFRWLTIAVDPRVLIPRPETELLVEVGLGAGPGASVLDVGTGSGAVALALKHERPDLAVRGVDVSADAVAAASANATSLGLDVTFTVGDLLEGVAAGSVDAVLANLPYVADEAALPDDVSAFEPAGALFGGVDGLDVIRRLAAAVKAWPECSRPGVVALEIGCDQGVAVSALLGDGGYPTVEVRRDLAGLDRVVVGRR